MHPVKVTTAGAGGSSASIEVKEKLLPAHDGGRFDLLVGSKKVKPKAATPEAPATVEWTWWSQTFNVARQPAIWIGADNVTWQTLGATVLTALGVEGAY